MTSEVEQNVPCDSCGCSAEMGFVIKEGDDVAEVSIFANNKAQLEAEFANYLSLAKEVCEDVEHNIELANDEKELHARLKFSCSAEKLIYELKTRSLRK
ncbi:YfcZ/YiiS family protein [Aliivibrio sp. EL58]|uniref:YfcZ/YiiS family protein n=1 Tax=Aliivibrio sp. EL58 TaxID=2107582 RepID=UPI000EFA8C2A|nr:YfcZ/YiiS family protein [Aliivibrio sp. EL58]